MPVICPLRLARITEAEFKELDYAVMKHAFACHNELGRLCDEVVYENDLAARLCAAGLAVQSQVPLHVTHRDFRRTYYLDAVVNERSLLELKAATMLLNEHERQTLHYLFLLGGPFGKLINFGAASVEHQTVNAVVSPERQRHYELQTDRWKRNSPRAELLLVTLVDLFHEFGVFLEMPFYESALTHFLGGEAAVLRRVILKRDGLPLGPQLLHHLDDDTGFKLTAFPHQSKPGEGNIRRLFALTPWRFLHWINFNRHHIELVTLEK